MPDKPSIAVLPFENMSGDPDQEFFADGITENILAILSKVSEMVVIARNSSFAYKGRSRDIRQVGRELGVSHVLEGSVQKGGNRVRITAQLIDARTGDHVWAERYDRTLEDIFAVQDQITREIVVAMSVRLAHGENARIWSGASKSFDAWETAMRAVSAHSRFTREGSMEARRLAHEALQIEPGNSAARLALAWALTTGARYGWVEDRDAALVEGESLASEFLELDPSDANAHALLGHHLALRRRYDEAIAAGERAIDLSPSIARHHAILALTLYLAGRYQDCLVRMRKAIRLSPYFPDWFLQLLAEGYRGTGQMEKAIEVLEHLATRAPDSLQSHTRLARIYAELGDKAKARADVVLSLDPHFSAEHFVSSYPFRDDSEHEKFVAGLRAAGLPE